MEPKEKAKELIEFFKPLVYSHVGSGFLTGDHDDGLILRNAKLCAHRCVDETILAINNLQYQRKTNYLRKWKMRCGKKN